MYNKDYKDMINIIRVKIQGKTTGKSGSEYPEKDPRQNNREFW